MIIWYGRINNQIGINFDTRIICEHGYPARVEVTSDRSAKDAKWRTVDWEFLTKEQLFYMLLGLAKQSAGQGVRFYDSEPRCMRCCESCDLICDFRARQEPVKPRPFVELKADLPHICWRCKKPVPDYGRENMIWNEAEGHIGYVCSDPECHKILAAG